MPRILADSEIQIVEKLKGKNDERQHKNAERIIKRRTLRVSGGSSSE
jgi:hypothetical protein